MAEDKSIDIKVMVAYNFNTSEETLRSLAKHSEARVRRAVAGNSRTPSDVLDKLAGDKDDYVKMYVAGNYNTSSDTLDKLAKASITPIQDFYTAVSRIFHKDSSKSLFDSEIKNWNRSTDVIRGL